MLRRFAPTVIVKSTTEKIWKLVAPINTGPLESLVERDQPPPASSPTGDPWLLTPGPLTTSPTVKQAMLHDYGSRDRHFIQVNERIRERLVDLVGGRPKHVCIPLQGSGTFVVEAMLVSFVPRNGKILLLTERQAPLRSSHNGGSSGAGCLSEPA